MSSISAQADRGPLRDESPDDELGAIARQLASLIHNSPFAFYVRSVEGKKIRFVAKGRVRRFTLENE